MRPKKNRCGKTASGYKGDMYANQGEFYHGLAAIVRHIETTGA
jgi:hypothetical protein